MAWTIYATGWRDDAIIDELPASDIEFDLAVSDHGKAQFTLTVPRGGAPWINFVRPLTTGVLICEDDQVRWGGNVIGKRRSGDRSFTYDALEWGSLWDRQAFTPDMRVDGGITGMDRSRIVELIAHAAVARHGTDMPLTLQVTDAGQTTDLIDDIASTSMKSVMSVIKDLCSPDGAPEWALNVEGPVYAPRRVLRVAPRLGRPTVAQSQLMFDFVGDYTLPPAATIGDTGRRTSTLGHLYPSPADIYRLDRSGMLTRARRHGGNVLADPGNDISSDAAATRVWTTPETSDRDQTVDPGLATANDLITAGWPLLEAVVSQPAAPTKQQRDAYAAGVLASRRGYTTTWQFSAFATDPPLADVQLGDQAGVSIESDLYTYAGPGLPPPPLRFETRLTGYSVKPDDNASTSTAVVTYTSVTPAGVLGF